MADYRPPGDDPSLPLGKGCRSSRKVVRLRVRPFHYSDKKAVHAVAPDSRTPPHRYPHCSPYPRRMRGIYWGDSDRKRYLFDFPSGQRTTLLPRRVEGCRIQGCNCVLRSEGQEDASPTEYGCAALSRPISGDGSSVHLHLTVFSQPGREQPV
jgi:hypothetical protein